MSRYMDAEYIIRKYINTDIEKFNNSDVRIVLENLKQNILKAPSIDLADYVPREFHDKTCEAMAKRHQEEIADILERADADRPQGEWVSDYSSPVAHRCTACNTLQHWSVIQNGRYRFCPNCGARMKGE